MRAFLLTGIAVLGLALPLLAQDAEVGKEYDITIQTEDSNQYTGPFGQAKVGSVVFDVPNPKKGEKYHVKVTDRFFADANETYDPEAAKKVQSALLKARAIVVTHEHGDHVAGVIHTPLVAELAPKTILTRKQVEMLETNPQVPELKITPSMASRYNVVDYDKYLPLGAGMALIKAPGHTPGSQTVYVALESGREYLFIGDTAWLMDGVRLAKSKAAPFLGEDDAAVMAELKWLNELYRTEKNLLIIVSHDDGEHKDLIKRGILGNGLE